jgi:riboflavin kinase/FMN adenylyltransferase
MITIQDSKDFPADKRGGVLCVGNFDGVHVGHQRMLRAGRDLARAKGVAFTIMTFEPHPNVILKPGTARFPLTTLDQRVELLGGFSPDVLVVVPTSKEFLSMPAEDFLGEVVRGRIGATHFVEGPTFTFGRGAKGDVEMLKARGGEFGFGVTIIETVEIVLTDLLRAKVSSSAIRWLVENGRVVDAGTALGRPYALRGVVAHGAKRGRAIGFPTANLQTGQLTPIAGVYAGAAVVDGARHRAAISIGANPTFDGKVTTVEAYLLDFDGDIYGQVMELEFHRYLREMVKFSGVEPLVRQMKLDVEQTREAALLANNMNGVGNA